MLEMTVCKRSGLAKGRHLQRSLDGANRATQGSPLQGLSDNLFLRHK